MIRVDDMPGEFVSQEVADRCRRMLLMLENMALPQRAVNNREQSRNVIVSHKPEREVVSELWIVSEGRNGKAETTEGTTVTNRGVVRAHSGAPRLSVRKQPGTVGDDGRGRPDAALVRMWAVREKLCSGGRVIAWPS